MSKAIFTLFLIFLLNLIAINCLKANNLTKNQDSQIFCNDLKFIRGNKDKNKNSIKAVTIAKFKVAIANNNEKRAMGLMYKKNLAQNLGMLFIFTQQNQESSKITMWMKNTFIPLDMIFFDKNNLVIGYQKNTKPQSTDIIETTAGTNLVLEVNSGLIDKLAIKIGDKIIFNDNC